MKRIAALLLVVVLALTLFACSNSSTATSPSASASAATSASASAATSAAASTAPSSAPSAAVSPSASTSASTSKIGYITDKVDYFSRKPYKFASLALNTATTYTQMINDSFTKWGKVMNFETLTYDAHMDYDAYVNEVQILADQGYNGLVVGMDDALLPRVYELTQELKIACVGMPTAFTDKDGHITWPSVNQNEAGNGAECAKWLSANYKNYWKDPVDAKKLGLIILDFSVVSGIHARLAGAKDQFIKDFPDAAKNVFVGDLVTIENGFSAAGGNTMTQSIIAAHSDITKWFVVGLVDDWAVGATRAAEELKRTKDVLVVSDQADAFVSEMQSGNADSVYVAACAVSTTELTGYCAANLVAIVDGRAKAETIWPEWVRKGDKYPCIDVLGTMLTKDTYKDWQTKTSFEAMSAGMKTGK